MKKNGLAGLVILVALLILGGSASAAEPNYEFLYGWTADELGVELNNPQKPLSPPILVYMSEKSLRLIFKEKTGQELEIGQKVNGFFAWVDGNTIYINQELPNPDGVVVHEIVHFFQYKVLGIKENDFWTEHIAKKMQQYYEEKKKEGVIISSL
jgi:hypothetical protein